MEKQYVVRKWHRGKSHDFVGTLEQLTETFSYTLLCGNSYNSKINRHPKTIKALMTALDKSIRETQNTYDPDSYELVM